MCRLKHTRRKVFNHFWAGIGALYRLFKTYLAMHSSSSNSNFHNNSIPCSLLELLTNYRRILYLHIQQTDSTKKPCTKHTSKLTKLVRKFKDLHENYKVQNLLHWISIEAVVSDGDKDYFCFFQCFSVLKLKVLRIMLHMLTFTLQRYFHPRPIDVLGNCCLAVQGSSGVVYFLISYTHSIHSFPSL